MGQPAKIMDHDHFRQKLVAEEQRLLGLLNRLVATGREDQPGGSDAVDQSIFTQEKEFRFLQADSNSKLLAEVRAALKRIEAGNYGACLADGQPIFSARLDIVPWASYCIEHQSLFDELSVPGSDMEALLQRKPANGNQAGIETNGKS